jgi:ABC-type transport system involved in multi-copper enzyme maturation permease subunit
VVTEREAGTVELMKGLGLRESAYWSAWLLHYSLVTALIALAATLICRTNVIPYSSPSLIFAYLYLYGLALFGYGVFMSSLFSSARIASVIANLLYFFSFFCDYAVQSPYQAQWQKILASFLPSIAMKRALYNILCFEEGKAGL